MTQWFQDEWQRVLETQGLTHFDQFWRLEGDQVEAPNEGRGGSSGVVSTHVDSLEGRRVKIFIKRQEDHLTRAPAPFLRRPTAQREFDNFRALAALGFSVPRIVYFGQQKGPLGWRAILITEELSGQVPLSDLEDRWRDPTEIRRLDRMSIIRNVAMVVRSIHLAGYRHGSLYPKHLFLDQLNLSSPISLIDLEKMRRTIFVKRARSLDLDALNRRTRWVSLSDRLVFLRAYLSDTSHEKQVWRELSRRFRRKEKRDKRQEC